MSDFTRETEDVDYNQTINELSNARKISSGGQTRSSASRQATNRTTTGTGTDLTESTGHTKSAENSQSDGTSRQESETTRSLTSRQSGSVQKTDRVNIGCAVTFTVKIRGGLPLTSNPAC